MKIDIRKSICPFCTLGCEIGISFTNGRFWSMYPETASLNQGRLCPRGNIAVRYLDYEKRLCYPQNKNRNITWPIALDEIRRTLDKYRPEELAVTFDKNLTIEEFQLIKSFSENLAIENFGSSYLEPEYYFNYVAGPVKNATYEDLLNGELFFLIGDAFNQSPVVAKFVLDSRYRKKDNRLIVLDSIKSYTMSFADVALGCEPGTEPIVVAAIIEVLNKNTKRIKEYCEISGVSQEKIEASARFFEKLDEGIIINVAAAGKVSVPLLHATLPALLTTVAPGKKTYLPLAESLSFVGKKEFAEIFSSIKSKKIKALINFGDFFPFFYPQLFEDLANLELLVTTSTLKHDNIALPLLVLPVPANLEKVGHINTAFGPQPINRLARPVSGAREVSEILKLLEVNVSPTPENASGLKIEAEKLTRLTEKFINKLKSQKIPTKTYQLLGEKIAFDFLNLLGESRLKVNPALAKTLSINENEHVSVQAHKKVAEMPFSTSTQVSHQHIAVSIEMPHIRSLFDFGTESDLNRFCLVPTDVKLWKKE